MLCSPGVAEEPAGDDAARLPGQGRPADAGRALRNHGGADHTQSHRECQGLTQGQTGTANKERQVLTQGQTGTANRERQDLTKGQTGNTKTDTAPILPRLMRGRVYGVAPI